MTIAWKQKLDSTFRKGRYSTEMNWGFTSASLSGEKTFPPILSEILSEDKDFIPNVRLNANTIGWANMDKPKLQVTSSANRLGRDDENQKGKQGTKTTKAHLAIWPRITFVTMPGIGKVCYGKTVKDMSFYVTLEQMEDW